MLAPRHPCTSNIYLDEQLFCEPSRTVALSVFNVLDVWCNYSGGRQNEHIFSAVIEEDKHQLPALAWTRTPLKVVSALSNPKGAQMKAVVFHGIGDIRLDDVPEPQVQEPTDAVVRLTASAICGTDLHMIRGTFTGMEPGTILGHEGVGVVEALGDDVRNLSVGDRVIIPSTIGCGSCSYCRAGVLRTVRQRQPKRQTRRDRLFRRAGGRGRL